MDTARPLTKRQQQAAATRERMLQAAHDVFAERGYQAASVGAITQRAETAHGTFYLYFRNKDDAFAQVLDALGEEIRAESRARLDPDRYAGTEGAIRGFLTVFQRHPGLMRALVEGMMSSPTVEASWRDLRAPFADRVAQRLAREREAGVVRADLDPEQAAPALVSMAEWYAFTHLVLGDRAPGQGKLDAAVATLTDLWVHAVYGTTAPDRHPA